MPPLLTAGEYKDVVPTSLPDSVVDTLIAREQALLERVLGAAYDGTAIVETHILEPYAGHDIYLKRRVASVVSISERSAVSATPVTLTTDVDYLLLPYQGRLLRLSGGWGAIVVVTYTPADDSEEWRRALIDLVRLATARTGLKSENIAGEYSYTAFDNPEAERSKILQGLGFFNI